MTEDINQEIPLLTFNSLYNLRISEKRTKKLQELPELFYEALKKFLNDKKAEIKKIQSDATQKDKLKKEKYILINSQKIANELLNLRCSKISNIAIQTQLFGNEILSEENILKEEQQLLKSVQKNVSSIQNKFK